jgi:hypothetical protein
VQHRVVSLLVTPLSLLLLLSFFLLLIRTAIEAISPNTISVQEDSSRTGLSRIVLI